jgi:DNA-binding transcriptional ArsR family regulator
MKMNTNLILKALANDNRLMIMQWLKNPTKHFSSDKCDVQLQGVCVGLIEKKLSLSQSTVSQYLQQLQRADLITMKRVGQWTFCTLNHATVKAFMLDMQTRLTNT